MEHIEIKGVKIPASRVALGTWAIGGWMWGGSDEKDAIETIHAALDQGINTIDTAPAYGFGRAEEIVGKALAEAVALIPLSPRRLALNGATAKYSEIPPLKASRGARGFAAQA